MNIKLCCVGKLKESYYIEACAEYAKRLSRYCSLMVHEVMDEPAPEQLSNADKLRVTEREGRKLLAYVDPKDYVIALCIEGAIPDSERFAARIAQLADGGARCVCFIIGGSLGLSDEVKARANEKLSLSRLTLPHRVARLVLTEQLYRAFKIIKNEPYHK